MNHWSFEEMRNSQIWSNKSPWKKCCPLKHLEFAITIALTRLEHGEALNFTNRRWRGLAECTPTFSGISYDYPRYLRFTEGLEAFPFQKWIHFRKVFSSNNYFRSTSRMKLRFSLKCKLIFKISLLPLLKVTISTFSLEYFHSPIFFSNSRSAANPPSSAAPQTKHPPLWKPPR